MADATPPRSDAPALPDARASRWFWAVAVALSLALVTVVAWVDYLPTNDGPQHIFAAYLQGHLDEPGRGWSRYLDSGAAVTGVGIVPLLGLLDRALPWQTAFRVTLAVLALTWAWGVVALAASLGPRRRWLGLLGFAAALQWQLYMGLLSCYLATALGLPALAVAFHFGLGRLRVLLLLAALLAGQATMHIVPTAMTGLVLVLYAALAAPPSARVRTVGGMLLAGLPATLVGLMAMMTNSDDGVLSRYGTTLPLGQQLALLARAFVSGPAWRAWPVTVLALVAGGLALARFIRVGSRPALPAADHRGREWEPSQGSRFIRVGSRPALPAADHRGREWEPSQGSHVNDARLRTLLFAGAGFLVLAVALPLHIRGWEFFSVRFIPYAILFWVLLLPVELPMRPWLPRAAVLGLVSFALAAMAWSLAHHRFLHRAHADFLAGIQAPLHRSGPRLPLFVEPPPGEGPDDWERAVPYVTTNLHVGPLFALTQGGVPAYLFAGAGAIHTLSYRKPPEGLAMPPRPARGYEWGLWEPAARQDPTMRERALAHMLGYAPAYEDIIFWGTPADHQAVLARGFRADFVQGGLLIAGFVGCPTRVRLEPPTEGLPPTLVLAGWWPDARPTFSTALPPRDANAPVELDLPGSPCGPLWVRVLYDVNRDGKLSPGDRTCRGADGNAVLRHQAAAGGNTVLCTAGEPLP